MRWILFHSLGNITRMYQRFFLFTSLCQSFERSVDLQYINASRDLMLALIYICITSTSIAPPITYFLFTITSRYPWYLILVLDPGPSMMCNLQLDNKTTWILHTTAVTYLEKPQSVWFNFLGLLRGWLAFSVHSPPMSTIPILWWRHIL